MNECFHAKCGERAREAPVCPACKHNNTDVSIHQVDPGKARRDLEKCLSRRHVDRIPLPNPLSNLPLFLVLFCYQPSAALFQKRFQSCLLGPPPPRSIFSVLILCHERSLRALAPLRLAPLRQGTATLVVVGHVLRISRQVIQVEILKRKFLKSVKTVLHDLERGFISQLSNIHR